MLCGTADPETLAANAPSVVCATEPLACHDVALLQVVYEVRGAGRQAMLPPALHPVNPPAITVTVLRAGSSEVGAFTLAETRIVCRSGARSRGYHVSGFVDGDDAGRVLADRWGYRTSRAEIEFSRRYHGTTVVVHRAGEVPLDVRLLDPRPLSAGDVQFTDTMHLARTPAGLRLVQVERYCQATEVERGRPMLAAFDGAAEGELRLVPTHPVSAVCLVGEVTFQPVRYLCRPDVNAMEGTERIG